MPDDERTYTLTESELRKALIEAYMAGNYDEADNQGRSDLVLDSAEQKARLVIDVLRESRPPAPREVKDPRYPADAAGRKAVMDGGEW